MLPWLVAASIPKLKSIHILSTQSHLLFRNNTRINLNSGTVHFLIIFNSTNEGAFVGGIKNNTRISLCLTSLYLV